MAEKDLASRFESILTRAASVKVKNVLNPLLWLCAVVTPTFLVAGYFADFQSTAGTMLIVISCIPVFSTLLAFLGFSLFDPDRLHSEQYLLKQQEFQMISKSKKSLELEDKTIDGDFAELEGENDA